MVDGQKIALGRIRGGQVATVHVAAEPSPSAAGG
jgi:hypothetical protein